MSLSAATTGGLSGSEAPAGSGGPLLERMDALIEQQEQVMLKRTTKSQSMRAEAESVLAGGVASSWQDAPPCAVWIDYGKGPRIWDVDGIEYVDLHGGFGVGLAGHAHPAIVAAVQDRVTKGTHFAQPTEDAIAVARELARALRPSAVALRQLGHRSHDGRVPPDARRPPGERRHHQGRRQLPRSPRRSRRCRSTPSSKTPGPVERTELGARTARGVPARWRG